MRCFPITLSFILIFCGHVEIFSKNFPNLEKYVAEHLPFAIAHAQTRGIPVAICLGQAIVESAYGESNLAIAANNHFGMKKGDTWKASIVFQLDDEHDSSGKLIPSKFRHYRNIEESYLDYSENLATFSIYKPLFKIPKTDYRAWAVGLQKCGYASSKEYCRLLIDVIEAGKLYEFDLPKNGGQEKREIWWSWWLGPLEIEENKPQPKSKLPEPEPETPTDLLACRMNCVEPEHFFE